MGGGGYKYNNWDITTTGFTKVTTNKVSSPNGTYTATTSAQTVTIVGEGAQKDAGGNAVVKVTILIRVPPSVDSTYTGN